MNEKCDYPYTCQNSLKSGSVIASGGFGKVLRYENKAIKLIRDATTCRDAQIEFSKMISMKNAIRYARRKNLSKNIRKILSRINSVQPLYFWNQSFSYRYERFSCGIVSKFIKGIPLKDLVETDENINLSVLVLVSMSTRRSYLSLMDHTKPLSVDNPPRYFVMSLSDAKKFYKDIHNFESAYGYFFQMGVIMALFIFLAKMVPIDLEILLGQNNKINMLDFGMCEDIQDEYYKDPNKIAELICHMGGPLYTKDSMEFNEQFRKGFIKASTEFDIDKDFLKKVVKAIESFL
jgi:hypothetical protein